MVVGADASNVSGDGIQGAEKNASIMVGKFPGCHVQPFLAEEKSIPMECLSLLQTLEEPGREYSSNLNFCSFQHRRSKRTECFDQYRSIFRFYESWMCRRAKGILGEGLHEDGLCWVSN